MKKNVLLAIESSCDDSSVAVVDQLKNILFHKTISSSHFHAKTGGIVPKTAAHAHSLAIPQLIQQVVSKRIPFNAVAVTQGPGIGPCLRIGITAAKVISIAFKVPLIGVHHMEGHLLSTEATFPFLGLLISGGHTLLVYASSFGNYKVIGQSLDDAVGEAYDKVARSLGLEWKVGDDKKYSGIFLTDLISFHSS